MAEIRGKKINRVCKCCQKTFTAREADVKRGWAKFCSKSCKAIEQEGRTGQFANYLNGISNRESTFSNAHQFSNED